MLEPTKAQPALLLCDPFIDWCLFPCAGAMSIRGLTLENHPEQLSSRRVVTENLVVSLVDEHRGGPLDGIGERESAPFDALGGEGRRALSCARMCTCSCFVGVGRVCAAVGTGGGGVLQHICCFYLVTAVACVQMDWAGGVGSFAGANLRQNGRAPVLLLDVSAEAQTLRTRASGVDAM